MRQTTFIKSKINYFGSFGRQRTWALLAQGGAVANLLLHWRPLAYLEKNKAMGVSSIQCLT